MGEHASGDLAGTRRPATPGGWPDTAAVLLSVAAGVGATSFIALHLQDVELQVGLALALGEVIGLAAAGALDWPGSRSEGYMFLCAAAGWLTLTLASGVALAMFALDTLPSGPLALLAAAGMLIAPIVASALAAIVADRIRQRVVRRHRPPHQAM